MPVAVVTGSSSGIGRATAIRFARDGYSVVLHAHQNLRGLSETVAEIRRAADCTSIFCVTADIASPRACVDLVSSAFGWQSRVDVWVNNAGADVLTGQASQSSFESRLRRLLDVDVLGTIRLSRLVAERMALANARNFEGRSVVEPLPSIINMSWDQAWLGMEGEPGQLFGTTKAAIAAFSQSLALSASGIRVNCVAPGWIKTDWGNQSANEFWNQRAIQECQLGRWGTPEDVAQAIRWLADPSSHFINGQTVSVNGGRRFYPAKYLKRP